MSFWVQDICHLKKILPSLNTQKCVRPLSPCSLISCFVGLTPFNSMEENRCDSNSEWIFNALHLLY